MELKELIAAEKVIMAVRDEKSLAAAINSDKSVVFLLRSNIITAPEVVRKCRKAGKVVFIHLDLMEGIGKDETALKFIADEVRPDGVITTKPQICSAATSAGLKVVFRVFLVDSQSLETANKTAARLKPTAVEVMPALMPSVISKMSENIPVLIAGGMVSREEEVRQALGSGALAVSTSAENLWKMKF